MFHQVARNRIGPRSLRVIALSLAFLSLPSSAEPQTVPTQVSPEVTTLELRKPLARQLAGNQKHMFRLQLGAGQYAKVVVEQRGIDVIVRMRDRNGKPIAEFDNEVDTTRSETAEIVASAADAYHIEVRARFMNSPVGSYEIRVEEIGVAIDGQRALQEARGLQFEAAKLRSDGKDDQAVLLTERSVSLAEKVLPADDPSLAYFLKLLADMYHVRREESKARVLYQRTLAIFEKSYGPEHHQYIETTRALGAVYAAEGDVVRADKLLRQALQANEKILGPDHFCVALSLRSLGVLYSDRGDNAKAIELFERALAIVEKTAGPEQPVAGELLNNLGIIASNMRDFARAEHYLVRALEVQEKLFGPQSPNLATVMQNLGVINRDWKKDYAAAEKYYLRALAIREKNLGPEHRDVGWTLNNIGNLHRSKGDYSKALVTLQRGLEILEKAGGPGRHVLLLGNIARTYAAMGDLANAIKFQTRVDAAIEKHIDLNLAIGSERQRLAFMNTTLERTDRSVSLSLQLAPDSEDATQVALLALLQRKGRVLDGMTDTLGALRRRANARDQALLDRLNESKTQLARLVLDGPQKSSSTEFLKTIKTLEETRENLESEISQHSAEFRAQSQLVTVAGVQAAIPKNAALIEFAIYRPFYPKAETTAESYGPARYAAYVLRQEGVPQGKDLGDAKEIDAAVAAFRQALRDPERRDVHQLARAADEKIMQPLRQLIGDATQLLISPDGELNLIPFQALVDDQGRYLIQRYAFTYLTTGRDLLRMQVARASKSDPLVIANPSFGEPDGAVASNTATPAQGNGAFQRSVTSVRNLSEVYFAPLSATALEASTIEKLFPESDVLAGTKATESAVKEVTGPKLLHIATHGFFLQRSAATTPTGSAQASTQTAPAAPISKLQLRGIRANARIDNPLLRSGLALAGANVPTGEGDDGLLTALEASGLNLWGTKLVVLSACDTGVGEVRNGEGVYGLRRAFVLAGAESLVMSLWPASDYTTRKLMTEYYKNLKQSMGRGAALREVQLNMLRKNKQLHPFYWANFIQSGEWANLDGNR